LSPLRIFSPFPLSSVPPLLYLTLEFSLPSAFSSASYQREREDGTERGEGEAERSGLLALACAACLLMVIKCQAIYRACIYRRQGHGTPHAAFCLYTRNLVTVARTQCSPRYTRRLANAYPPLRARERASNHPSVHRFELCAPWMDDRVGISGFVRFARRNNPALSSRRNGEIVLATR